MFSQHFCHANDNDYDEFDNKVFVRYGIILTLIIHGYKKNSQTQALKGRKPIITKHSIVPMPTPSKLEEKWTVNWYFVESAVSNCLTPNSLEGALALG
jgi:hypothetical protein